MWKASGGDKLRRSQARFRETEMIRHATALLLLGFLPLVPPIASAAEREDILIADFEGKDYGDWKVTGEAFGPGPARGTLPNQMLVSGFLGQGLVNSYFHGDDTEGTLTSPEFQVERKRLNFLVGGGRHPGDCCINLLVDGKVVRTATGHNSEHLRWQSWDIAEFAGKPVRIEIVDRRKGSWGHINVDHIVQSDNPPAVVDERDGLLAQAEASVKKAIERVRDDPNRPVYHVLPPANWNNDPNGPIFHKGWYHLFYQFNPYGDDWGHMHWGHVRSRDLVSWEHLPIALWPSHDLGEEHVFSGCAAVNNKGGLMLLYTSIGSRLPEQWAAVPEDADLIRWKKHAGNPVLTEKLHGDVKVHEWRDPFAFRHDGKTYLVLGGNLNANKGGEAVVNVYRAEIDDLTQWQYLGVLFRHPDPGVKNIECPNFFPLGDRWVLIVSQGQPVQYFVGDLDAKTMKFTALQRGIMDAGNYYAPNCTEDRLGRRVLWGWVNGFPAKQGWNGCLTLPRVLTLGPDNTLRQEPVPELSKLRGKDRPVTNHTLTDTARVLEKVQGDVLEIRAEFELQGAEALGLRVRRSADGKQAVTIRFDGKELEVAGTKSALPLRPGEKTLRLHVFLDKSVLEVYANDRACVTRVIQAGKDDLGVEAFATGGTARLQALECWQLASIWAKPDR
jgi:sucrose-6-phosphate hydrolase SacC (GH32 family)